MSHRKLQLNAIKEPVIIQQDYDLVAYMRHNNITEAYGYGDIEYFSDYITFVEHATKFGIMIINTSCYNFIWLKDTINDILQNKIQNDGVLYLAINKFLAYHVVQNSTNKDNYDLAIEEFIRINVNATIDSYQYEPNDCGQSFNFAHPLTRFYLHK
jgi:hypothetical protein